MNEEVAVVLSSLPYWLQPQVSKSGRCIQFHQEIKETLTKPYMALKLIKFQ